MSEQHLLVLAKQYGHPTPIAREGGTTLGEEQAENKEWESLMMCLTPSGE